MLPLQEKKTRGFTLIELITVVVLLSVLGVVAMARLDNLGGFSQKAFFDEVVSAVRYAQKLAVSSGCSVQVTLTGTGFSLHQGASGCDDTTYTRDVLDPADRASAYANANPQASISPGATFVFTSQSNVTGLSLDQAFTVNGRQFRIYRATGLVDVL